jgi:hypothetical protein
MAIVHCRNANGVVLRLHEMLEVLPGIKEARPSAARSSAACARNTVVELRPGRNEVDDSFWAAWSDQNKSGSPFIEEEKQQQPEQQPAP